MSTLHSFSLFLGKAMNLPPVFFKKVPFIRVLDKRIALTRLLGGSVRPPHRPMRKPRNQVVRQRATEAYPRVLEGVVTQGTIARFAIEGVDFSISAGTWIIGDLKLGSLARVKGAYTPDGLLEATSVVVAGL